MRVLSQLEIKEHIHCGLFRLPSAHPLKMALVSVCSLYDLECTLCTYKHTFFLKHPTPFYDMFHIWACDDLWSFA